MPQLDKYIFFNHVITLTIFFCLIYIFLRKSVIPYISTTLKYRKKRINLFTTELENYERVYSFSKLDLENKGKIFSIKLFESLNKLITFYNKHSMLELAKIYNINFNIINKSSNLIFFSKNRKEFKRLSDVQLRNNEN